MQEYYPRIDLRAELEDRCIRNKFDCITAPVDDSVDVDAFR